MISNTKHLKNVCCEPLNKIENYSKAINDDKFWDCHHRLETDRGMTFKELKDANLDCNRPAAELIFLPKPMHQLLHLYYGAEDKSIFKRTNTLDKKTNYNIMCEWLCKDRLDYYKEMHEHYKNIYNNLILKTDKTKEDNNQINVSKIKIKYCEKHISKFEHYLNKYYKHS